MLLKASGLPIALTSLYLCLMCAIFFSTLEPKMQPTALLRRKQQLATRIALPHSPVHSNFSRSIVYLFTRFSPRTHSRSRSSDTLLPAVSCCTVRGLSRMKEKMALMQFFGMFLVQSWQLCSLAAESSCLHYSSSCLQSGYSCLYCCYCLYCGCNYSSSFTYFIDQPKICSLAALNACCNSPPWCSPQKQSSDSARKSSLSEKASILLSSCVQMEILELSGAPKLQSMRSKVFCQSQKWFGSRNCEFSECQQKSESFWAEWATRYLMGTWRGLRVELNQLQPSTPQLKGVAFQIL